MMVKLDAGANPISSRHQLGTCSSMIISERSLKLIKDFYRQLKLMEYRQSFNTIFTVCENLFRRSLKIIVMTTMLIKYKTSFE